jgi:hypothetical protein
VHDGPVLPADVSGNHQQLRLAGRLHFFTIMLTILIIVLLIALLGGGLGYSRFGYAGWSPAAIILVVLLVMLLLGRV